MVARVLGLFALEETEGLKVYDLPKATLREFESKRGSLGDPHDSSIRLAKAGSSFQLPLILHFLPLSSHRLADPLGIPPPAK